MLMIAIASLIAIAWLAGAIVFRLPVADRAKRAALPAEERVFWSVVISVATTTTLAFVLAAMGVYSLTRWSGAIRGLPPCLRACRAAISARRAATSARLERGDPCRADCGRKRGCIRIASCGVRVGGRDPGVYVNEGIQIAQSRSLVTTDRIAASVPQRRAISFSLIGRSELLQRALHGIPPARS